ncbi:hypothetical protein SAMD00019534_021010 [Acytostelium subglobosum LB1]|uniref:hypothetical protein n=1 Tax=Acytostelium subglobosum LB1 TaxID=1410327 RepID=UPI000644888D|nr:hypothetical protein SAMD00019534_021010 [Acytostelium subglobosum LB1]GAM18926.1 hypothetical protein SAMD00019534_021010 [Acytostelium subglobosum LB1]|eukprot:XP_012758146.1 hypothetical protein SAMD00019534_021010 [Acytostelium subglobosum LB1]
MGDCVAPSSDAESSNVNEAVRMVFGERGGVDNSMGVEDEGDIGGSMCDDDEEFRLDVDVDSLANFGGSGGLDPLLELDVDVVVVVVVVVVYSLSFDPPTILNSLLRRFSRFWLPDCMLIGSIVYVFVAVYSFANCCCCCCCCCCWMWWLSYRSRRRKRLVPLTPSITTTCSAVMSTQSIYLN